MHLVAISNIKTAANAYKILKPVDNRDMAIILDIILLCIIIYVGAYIGLSFVSMSLLMKLLCSGLITFVAVSLIRFAYSKLNGKEIKYRKFITYLIWQGEDYAKELLAQLCLESQKPFEDRGEYLLIDGAAVFLWTKYGNLSADTMVKFYRTCKKDGITKAYVLTTNGDKKVLAFVKSFGDVILMFSTFKPIYKKLKSQNSLPEDVKIKIPAKEMFFLVLQTAFNRKNGFRFIGVSALLLAISFVTPFKNYYVALASVNLALSLGCLISGFIKK